MCVCCGGGLKRTDWTVTSGRLCVQIRPARANEPYIGQKRRRQTGHFPDMDVQFIRSRHQKFLSIEKSIQKLVNF